MLRHLYCTAFLQYIYAFCRNPKKCVNINVVNCLLTRSKDWNIMYEIRDVNNLTHPVNTILGLEVESMLEKIMDLLAKQLRIDVNTLSPDTNIIEDLGADSLDVVEMLMAIEENFGITVSDEEAITLKTLSDVADFIEKKL